MQTLPAVMLRLGHPEDSQGSIRYKHSNPERSQGDIRVTKPQWALGIVYFD